LYTRNPGKDALFFCKSLLSNQLARFAPQLYVKLTHPTGRDAGEGDALQVANYFIECFRDYQKHLGLNSGNVRSYLRDKVILEYGPGDILGVALLFYAHGAEMVHCVDRFPLSKMSDRNIEVYVHLLSSLGEQERQRAESAFKEKGKPASGLDGSFIDYRVTKNGLSGESRRYDLVISRAVLEHVNDLNETMLDIERCMKDSGISLHKVDLKSHGLDRYTDFDFLTWPTLVYNLMHSHKGYPNRWRVDKYRQLAEEANLHVRKLIPTGRLSQEKLNVVYPELAREFSHIDAEELSWLGFWIHLEHAR
jgi:hypothetical protein